MEEEWACSACTFRNTPSSVRCSMCGSAREDGVGEPDSMDAPDSSDDEEIVGGELAVPAAEAEHLAILSSVTAKYDRGEGILFIDASLAVEAADQHFDEAAAQVFIRNKLSQVLRIYLKIDTPAHNSWFEIRKVWRGSGNEHKFIAAFERAVKSGVSICLKQLRTMGDADQGPLQLMELLVDRSHRLYYHRAHSGENHGHCVLYNQVCVLFRDSGCLEKLLTRVHLELNERKNWGQAVHCLAPFVQIQHLLPSEAALAVPSAIMSSLQELDDAALEAVACNETLGELFATLAKLAPASLSAGAAVDGEHKQPGTPAVSVKSLVIDAWQYVASRCFFSEKLRLRRFGTEQIGALAASRLISRAQMTAWVHAERILEDMLGPRCHPRVVPCADKLLGNIDLTPDTLDGFLAQIGITAVQALLGALSAHMEFDAELMVHVLSKTRAAIVQGGQRGADAFSFTSKFLGTEKAGVVSILYKGTTVAKPCLDLLWEAMRSDQCSPSDSEGFLGTLGKVASHVNGKPCREGLMVRCIEIVRASVQTSSEQDMRIALRVIEKVCTTFPVTPTKLPLASATHTRSVSALLRAAFIETVEEKHQLSSGLLTNELEAFIARSQGQENQDAVLDGVRARLELLRFLHQSSGLRMPEQQVSRLWALFATAPRSRLSELFFHWLRNAQDSTSHVPCFDPEVLGFILRSLFCQQTELSQMQARGFHCLQAIFVSVNNNENRFVAEDSEAIADGMIFRRQGPPEQLRGKRLIGSRVRVQFKDGKMHEGVVVDFDVGFTQKHKILYNNGERVDQMMSLLTQWHLLGAEGEARAGPVTMTEVTDEDLIGLEAVWSVFLHAVDADVSRAASDLLFSVYDKMHSVQTAESLQQALEERQALLAHLPEHKTYEVGDMLDVQRKYEAEEGGHYLSQWCAAQVTALEEDCVSVYSITVAYIDPELAGVIEDISLLTQHEDGITDEGGVGPRLARADTRSLGAAERPYSDEEVAVLTARGPLMASPLVKLPGSDCRCKLTDRLFEQLKSESTGEQTNNALVHRTLVLLERFLGEYAAKTTARSHLGCGRGQMLVLTLTQGFGAAAQANVLSVHGKITLNDLRQRILEMCPDLTNKTLQLQHQGKVLPASNQTLEEVEVGPGAATLEISNSKVGIRCKSCYHVHGKGDICGHIVSLSSDYTRKSCTCTVQSVATPKRARLPASCRSWSPGNELSESRSRFCLLLNLLERPLASTTRMVLWHVLIASPTNREEWGLISSSDMDWPTFFEKESFWRIIYSLHIVDAQLLPADEAGMAQADAWRKGFIESTGFASLVQFFASVERQPCWTSESLAAAIGLPVILRILNFCVAGSLGAASLAQADSVAAATPPLAGRPAVERQFSARSGALIAETVDFNALAGHLVTTVQHVHALLCSEETMALVPREIAVAQAAIDGIASLQTIFRKDRDLALGFFKSKMGFLVRDLLLRSTTKRIREKTSSALLEMSRLSPELMIQCFAMLDVALATLQPSSTICSEYFALFAKLVPSARAAEVSGLLPGLSTLRHRIVQRLTSDDAPLAAVPGEDGMMVGLINLLVPLVDVSTGGGIETTNFLRLLFHDCLMTLPRAGDGREPRCRTSESRQAAFRLLHALVRKDHDMQLEFVSMMTKFVNRSPAPRRRKDRGWEFEQDWDFDAAALQDVTSQCKTRNATEQVGLLNRGMTCYVNSVLQQLFRLPKLRKAILSLPPPLPKQTQLPAPPQEAAPSPGIATATSDVVADAKEDNTGVDEVKEVAEPSAAGQKVQQCVTFEDTFSDCDDDLAAAMKASMQDATASHSKSKASEAVSEEQGNTDKGEVIRQLQRAFLFMQDGRQGCFDPYPFVLACHCLNLNFRVTSQNDATELYDKVVDCIEEGMKGSPQLAVLKELFGGEEIRQKTCHKCKQTFSVSSAAFNRLELQCKDNDIMKASLVECLEVFTQPEVMKGDNQVFCEKCQAKCDMTFGTCIHTLPNVLPLHLKRFDFDVRTFRTVKLNQSISFPLELDMHPYTETGIQQREKMRKRQAAAQRKSALKQDSGADADVVETKAPDDTLDTSIEEDDTVVLGGASGAAAGVTEQSAEEEARSSSDEDSDVEDDSDTAEQHCWYDLVGTVVHRGQAGGGHYYSFAKDVQGTRWFKLNDDNVTLFDPASKSGGIEAECFGGEEERTVTAYGYSSVETCERDNSALMLFYVRRGYHVDEMAPDTGSQCAHGLVAQQPQLVRQRSDPGSEIAAAAPSPHAATPPLIPSLQRSLSHSEASAHNDRHVRSAIARLELLHICSHQLLAPVLARNRRPPSCAPRWSMRCGTATMSCGDSSFCSIRHCSSTYWRSSKTWLWWWPVPVGDQSSPTRPEWQSRALEPLYSSKSFSARRSRPTWSLGSPLWRNCTGTCHRRASGCCAKSRESEGPPGFRRCCSRALMRVRGMASAGSWSARYPRLQPSAWVPSRPQPTTSRCAASAHSWKPCRSSFRLLHKAGHAQQRTCTCGSRSACWLHSVLRSERCSTNSLW